MASLEEEMKALTEELTAYTQTYITSLQERKES